MDKDFTLDPAIPLPIELEEQAEYSSSLNDTLAQSLSLEMILAGMLRVITDAEIDPDWLHYYRQFILVLKPDIFNEFTKAAIIKAKNNDFKSALEINKVLEGLFPMSADVLLNKALLDEYKAEHLSLIECLEMLYQGNNEKALPLLRVMIEDNPKAWNAWYVLGWALYRLGRYKDAIESLKQAHELAKALFVESKDLDIISNLIHSAKHLWDKAGQL